MRSSSSTRNATDRVFNETDTDGTAIGSKLLLSLSPEGSGYFGTFTVTLQMDSTAAGASALTAPSGESA